MSRLTRYAFLGLAAVFWAAPAMAAGGLSVSPVSLSFGVDGRPQALEVSNPGAADTEVQVRLFAWDQVDGEDRLTPSDDIGFSPPMFRLEPGGRQVVRLAPMKPAGGRESAYRLMVDQLPEEAQPGRLQMPVRMALPLFVGGAPEAGASSPLAWRVVFADGRARLVAANRGPHRVKVMELGYVAGGERRSIAPGLSGYVLAGAERAWSFDYRGPPGKLELELLVDGQPARARAEPAGP